VGIGRCPSAQNLNSRGGLTLLRKFGLKVLLSPQSFRSKGVEVPRPACSNRCFLGGQLGGCKRRPQSESRGKREGGRFEAPRGGGNRRAKEHSVGQGGLLGGSLWSLMAYSGQSGGELLKASRNFSVGEGDSAG